MNQWLFSFVDFWICIIF